MLTVDGQHLRRQEPTRVTDPAIHVRLDSTSRGGWHVLVGRPGEGFVRGEISAEQVAAAVVAIGVLQWGNGGLLVAGRDSERSRLEAVAGRALSVALTGTPELARAYGHALGHAPATGGRLIVASDSDEP